MRMMLIVSSALDVDLEVHRIIMAAMTIIPCISDHSCMIPIESKFDCHDSSLANHIQSIDQVS